MNSKKPSLMKPNDRYDFIINYISSTRPHAIDVLNSEFVDAYIKTTGAKYKPTFFGAFKCAMLGRDLSKMYNQGMLDRSILSLPPGSINEGFPGWVYVYSVRSWVS